MTIPICEKLEREWSADLGSRRGPVNPDGPEAAAIIRGLVEALKQVRDWRVNGAPGNWVATCEEMRMLADAALSRAQVQP